MPLPPPNPQRQLDRLELLAIAYLCLPLLVFLFGWLWLPYALAASVPLALADCGDWRGALKADFSDPLRIRFAGSYPASCGEKVWPVAYADPKTYAQRAVLGLWESLGGSLQGSVRLGTVPSTLAAGKPAFVSSSAPLSEVVRDINKYSNNVMAQQLFLTLSQQPKGVRTADRARELVRHCLTRS
eukprot:gene45577-55783_t